MNHLRDGAGASLPQRVQLLDILVLFMETDILDIIDAEKSERLRSCVLARALIKSASKEAQ
jgi:hypothetical protein